MKNNVNYSQVDKKYLIPYDNTVIKNIYNKSKNEVKNKNIRYREFTVAIDFDDTIAEAHNFPQIGELKEGADIYINKLYDLGYNIIINTCRTDNHQHEAENYLKEKGIKFHHINCNVPANIEFFKQDCRKISADVYIDDRCVMGLPDSWEEIYNLTLEKAKNYYEKYTVD